MALESGPGLGTEHQVGALQGAGAGGWAGYWAPPALSAPREFQHRGASKTAQLGRTRRGTQGMRWPPENSVRISQGLLQGHGLESGTQDVLGIIC